jgi:putative restriction endonuclease
MEQESEIPSLYSDLLLYITGSIKLERMPKKEGGVDEVQNGVALCKLHHWAVDSGWFSFTDDYKIIVRDTSDRDGYSDFIDLQGKSLNLPEQNRLCPNPKFIRSHRLLHGFEE